MQPAFWRGHRFGALGQDLSLALARLQAKRVGGGAFDLSGNMWSELTATATTYCYYYFDYCGFYYYYYHHYYY